MPQNSGLAHTAAFCIFSKVTGQLEPAHPGRLCGAPTVTWGTSVSPASSAWSRATHNCPHAGGRSMWIGGELRGGTPAIPTGGADVQSRHRPPPRPPPPGSLTGTRGPGGRRAGLHGFRRAITCRFPFPSSRPKMAVAGPAGTAGSRQASAATSPPVGSAQLACAGVPAGRAVGPGVTVTSRKAR